MKVSASLGRRGTACTPQQPLTTLLPLFRTARDKLASSRRRASQVLMSTSARWREMQTGEAHRNFVHWEGEGEELLQDAPEEPEHSSGNGTGEPCDAPPHQWR